MWHAEQHLQPPDRLKHTVRVVGCGVGSLNASEPVCVAMGNVAPIKSTPMGGRGGIHINLVPVVSSASIKGFAASEGKAFPFTLACLHMKERPHRP